MMEYSKEVIFYARDQLATAQERSKEIKSELEEAVNTEKVWADFLRFVSQSWFMHTLDLLDKQASIFKKLAEAEPHATSVLENVRLVARTAVDEIIRRYPAHLEEAFRKANLPLDSDSRHPRYTLENRFFLLEIDEKKRIARLSDNEGRLAELPADVGAIVEVIQKEHKRIFGQIFDGKKFLKQLRIQYLAVINKEKQHDGVSIPIRRITSRLGKNIKGFRTDEFLLSLSRLAEKGPLEIDGRRLDLQQTKDTNQGMLLHGAAGRGYIGFIMFKEV